MTIHSRKTYGIKAVILFLFVFLSVQCQQKTIIEGKGDLYVLYQEDNSYRIVAAGVDGN